MQTVNNFTNPSSPQHPKNITHLSELLQTYPCKYRIMKLSVF